VNWRFKANNKEVNPKLRKAHKMKLAKKADSITTPAEMHLAKKSETAVPDP